MTEHPTMQELDEYRRRVLAPRTFLSVHQHVTTCQSCSAQCDSPEDRARDLNSLREALVAAPDDTPYHLSTAEVTSYTEGTLDEIDREIAESHLEDCAACRSEVRREVRSPVRPVVAPKSRISFPLAGRWQPIRVAAAMLAGLAGVALIVLALWLFRGKPGERGPQIAGPVAAPSPVVEASPSPAPSASPSTPAESALVLNDGSLKVTIDAQGTIAGLERLPAAVQERVGAALKAGRLQQPSGLDQLAGPPSTLLGPSTDGLPFQLLGPIGRVLRAQQPTFRWQALPGAQSYKVTVTDSDLNEVATSPTLNTTEWRIAQPLQPGRIYSWQVTALKDGASITSPVLPAPQAKFKIVDRATTRMLQQIERAYPDSHLARGVLYTEAGLLDEAEQEFRLLVRDNPRADVAQKLLRSVQAMRAARASASGS